jgi:hypothetical protein
MCSCFILQIYDTWLFFFMLQEEPCDVATVKEELADEITVDECYVCFDR